MKKYWSPFQQLPTDNKINYKQPVKLYIPPDNYTSRKINFNILGIIIIICVIYFLYNVYKSRKVLYEYTEKSRDRFNIFGVQPTPSDAYLGSF